MINTQLAVVIQEIRKADFLVPDDAHQEYVIRLDDIGGVLFDVQLTSFAHATQQTALAPQSHPIGIQKAHATALPSLRELARKWHWPEWSRTINVLWHFCTLRGNGFKSRIFLLEAPAFHILPQSPACIRPRSTNCTQSSYLVDWCVHILGPEIMSS